MKVQTGLKAGALLEDVVETVTDTANQVSTVFTNAGGQAADLTDKMVTKATAVWNALVS